jgi:hypothetical protein
MERTLLHQEDLGVGPQPLPPVGTGGTPVPNVPAQPGQPVPNVPSQPGLPIPDHEGAGPLVTPGIGQPVGLLSTRDDGANYCAYFTPEGGSEQILTCVGRSFLGPLDSSMPREETSLIFYDPLDVPPTGPVVTPDVPPTPAVNTPDVPPTPGVTTPDVPPVPVGSLGDSPSITMDVDVSYSYDESRLEPLLNLLGEQSWSPIGPTPDDAAWLASPANAAALTVTVTVYKDGVSQGTIGHSIPALGQVLAAAEMTAGTI